MKYYVCVFGSRSFNDWQLMCDKLDKILADKHPDVVIVSGDANGADRLGERYAISRGYECEKFPADWAAQPRRAGYIRNVVMADHVDAGVGFWNGTSRGTKHMFRLLRQRNKPVREVRF